MVCLWSGALRTLELIWDPDTSDVLLVLVLNFKKNVYLSLQFLDLSLSYVEQVSFLRQVPQGKIYLCFW